MKFFTQFHDYPQQWSAIDDNYDAAWRGDEDGWVSNHPMGWGETEDEAINDLVAQMEERAEERGEPLDLAIVEINGIRKDLAEIIARAEGKATGPR